MSTAKIIVGVSQAVELLTILTRAAELLAEIRDANPDVWPQVSNDVAQAVAAWRAPSIPAEVAAVVSAGVTGEVGHADVAPEAHHDQVTQFQGTVVEDAAQEAPTIYADASAEGVGTHRADHEQEAPPESRMSNQQGDGGHTA